MAIGNKAPHYAVRFRWHAPGVVIKSLGAVIPTRTPFTWPASNYSRTSSARLRIDPTTTGRLSNRHLCPDVLRKGRGQSPAIVRGDRSAGLSRCLTSRTGTSGSYAQSYRTLRPWHVQHCRPRTAPVRAANRQLKILAGGGIFPVDLAVPRGHGRRAHPHGSG